MPIFSQEMSIFVLRAEKPPQSEVRFRLCFLTSRGPKPVLSVPGCISDFGYSFGSVADQATHDMCYDVPSRRLFLRLFLAVIHPAQRPDRQNGLVNFQSIFCSVMLGGQVQAAVAGASLPQGGRASSIFPLLIQADLFFFFFEDFSTEIQPSENAEKIETRNRPKGDGF